MTSTAGTRYVHSEFVACSFIEGSSNFLKTAYCSELYPVIRGRVHPIRPLSLCQVIVGFNWQILHPFVYLLRNGESFVKPKVMLSFKS